ncbi:transcription antitermination factor NusB [Candidatus Solincola tengchongensis]|uniref:transcription antitermination factor NusB n=1 Tax=Candidatus Solincola tengchongensis TaxID=2900693 RepID=UPI00257F6E68
MSSSQLFSRRTLARKLACDVLYRMDLTGESLEEAADSFRSMLKEGVEEHPQPPDGIPDISLERVRLLLGEEAVIEELYSFGSSTLVYPADLPGFSIDLLRAYLEHGEEIDRLIDSYADRWSLQRMPLVDRNLLRLAIAELLYLPEVPPGVTVNEYVELAKVFSTEDSGKFVNGILGRVLRERAGKGEGHAHREEREGGSGERQ